MIVRTPGRRRRGSVDHETPRFFNAHFTNTFRVSRQLRAKCILEDRLKLDLSIYTPGKFLEISFNLQPEIALTFEIKRKKK
jgi:hypothetical protein